MSYYIKKSVKPIEAKELKETNHSEILEWCCGSKGSDGSIHLKAPESEDGFQTAVTGDFIVRGHSEELGWHFLPVKPSHFNDEYVKVLY